MTYSMQVSFFMRLILNFNNTIAQKPKNYEVLADSVIVQNVTITTSNLPKGYRFDKDLGLLLHNSITGQVIHRNYEGGLYETRAVKTPGGDYLLMFPNGGHYGGAGKAGKKVNDLVAFRSKDQGKIWEGPKRCGIAGSG